MFLLNTLKTVSKVALFCGAVASCAFARGACSTGTFHGAYSFSVAGFILPALAIGEFGFGGGEGAVPIQGVQLITSDGHGNLTDKEAMNLGGQPLAATAANPFASYSGTYTINSDCTGTAFLSNAPNANFENWALIIDPTGTKVRMVAVPPYDSGGIERVISSVGESVEGIDARF